MKTLINLLLALFLVFAFSCKTREKQVQKSENQTETKSEASAKIETKTIEIVQDKELSNFGKSKIDKSEETSKKIYKRENTKKFWKGFTYGGITIGVVGVVFLIAK